MDRMVVRDVCKSYGGAMVLNHFCLTVKAGECLTLFGPEASGKTTLFRILSGLDAPDSGTIEMDGQMVWGGRKGECFIAQNHQVGMVFAENSLWPHMTVYDNVAFGMRQKGCGKDEIKTKVFLVLERTGTQHLAHHMPENLTKAQEWRVAVARALSGAFQTILIDGFPTGLDCNRRAALRSDLKQIHRETGLTLLFATRDCEDALTVSTRVAVLDNGRIAQVDLPMKIYHNPKTLGVAQQVGLLPINLISAKGQVAGGLLTVQSFFGVFQYKQSSAHLHIKEGALFDCVIGIRPERIKIYSQHFSESVEGRVCACALSGAESVVQFAVNGQILTASCSGFQRFQIGQHIYATFDTDDANIFHAESEWRLN